MQIWTSPCNGRLPSIPTSRSCPARQQIHRQPPARAHGYCVLYYCRHFSRDANSNWPCTATDVRFRSSQRRRARLSPSATGVITINLFATGCAAQPHCADSGLSRVVSERREGRLPGCYSCPQCRQSIAVAKNAASMPDRSSYLPEIIAPLQCTRRNARCVTVTAICAFLLYPNFNHLRVLEGLHCSPVHRRLRP